MSMTSHAPHPRCSRRLWPALAALPLAVHAGSPVLPTGATVVHGRARIDTSGDAMTVTTTRNAAIDWRSFSIGPKASVRFDQPDASSRVLNRVLGRDPSHILGRLGSNGEVWLVNPYGVLFGRDARVDVGGLVASTLNVSLADWAAGRRRLSAAEGIPATAVVNAGTLRSRRGGRIVLVGAGGVDNDGFVEAPGGRIELRAGASVDLADSTMPDVAVRVGAHNAAVTNRGALLAPGGIVDLQAAMVNQSGIVRADGFAGGPGGTVRLVAGEALNLEAGSLTSAAGAPGGRVDLLGGTQLVRGRIDAGSPTGVGGQVSLAAPRIALLDGAALQVDGASGGGRIAIGLPHDAFGSRVPAAQAVHFGAGAIASADARVAGDGGHIRLWSDSATRVFGGFSARGGPAGGDGGSIDTSGGGLQAQPSRMDTWAPRGRAGLWLLDPLNIEIFEGTGETNVDKSPNFSAIGPLARIGTSTIATALQNGDVTISTGTAGSDAGIISMENATLSGSLHAIAPAGHTLTLQAASAIRLKNANILSSTDAPAAPLHVRLLAGEGASDDITLTSSRIDVRGNVTMRANRITTDSARVLARSIELQARHVAISAPVPASAPAGGGAPTPLSTLDARGGGNALTVRGLVDNVDTFTNKGGSQALVTTANGRWLLYARDPASTELDGLPWNFKQYGAVPPAAAQATGNGLLFATQPLLGVATTGTVLPLDKVYDGGTALALTAAQLGAVSLTGFLNDDVPSTSPGMIAGLDYESAQAGTGIPLIARLSGPLPSVSDKGRPVFGYGFSGRGLFGTIAPAPASVAAATVADKVYDGSTAATVTSWSLGGILGGDDVGVARGSAAFADPQAARDKPVVAVADVLGGADAANYRIAQASVASRATIEQATLTYTAQPTTVVAGAGWPALIGTIAGFVAGESAAAATTGTPRFDSTSGPASPPGVYALSGSGLDAPNYRLVQDPANATALRILPAQSDDVPPRIPLPPTWPPDTGSTGGPTVVPPIPPSGFPPVDFGSLPTWRIDAEARSRAWALRHAFRESITMLESNPNVARLPDCADIAGAMRGECIVTPAIKGLMTRLWEQHPAWSGLPPSFDRFVLFDRTVWGDEFFDLFAPNVVGGPQFTLLRGDGSVQVVSAQDIGTNTIAAQLQQAGAAGGGGGAAAVPLPVIVASDTSQSSLHTLASPVSGVATTCTTPRQRLSGECRRPPEFEAVREATAQCAQRGQDEQPTCLFSERIKARLRQIAREQGGRVPDVLGPAEVRRAVLPGIRRKWALVIGIENYPKVKLGGNAVHMPSAKNDVAEISKELKQRFGYATRPLVDPTRAEVVQYLNMLAAVAQPEDSLLVFFSGYGFTIAQGEDAVWALTDADPADGRTVLSHADLARLLGLLDARQVALISDSTLAGRLRVKAVDYDPKAAPDASGLLGRRATVALTSGGNLPIGSVNERGLSDFATQLVSVLRRVSTWHVGGRVFREVQGPLIQSGRPFVPQYGAASESLHDLRADYLFERRELEAGKPAKP